jgi:hypothetical protein
MRSVIPRKCAATILICFGAWVACAGCAPPIQVRPTYLETAETKITDPFTDQYLVDFRPFVERGFLISPWRPSGEYDLVANVRVEYHPSTELVVTTRLVEVGEISKSPFVNEAAAAETSIVGMEWSHQQKWEIQQAMEEMYKTCLTLEADGLIEFHISSNEVGVSQVVLRATTDVQSEFLKSTEGKPQRWWEAKAAIREDLLAQTYRVIVIEGYAIRQKRD